MDFFGVFGIIWSRILSFSGLVPLDEKVTAQAFIP